MPRWFASRASTSLPLPNRPAIRRLLGHLQCRRRAIRGRGGRRLDWRLMIVIIANAAAWAAIVAAIARCAN